MARIRKCITNENTLTKEVVWKIAFYIRLSKDDGNDESLSITNQRKILTKYVSQFLQGKYVVAGEYIDDGKTGTDYDRPNFQRMIHDVETKKVNCVICKNLARAFRNYSDQGYFIESFFALQGTRFITLGDPKVDTYLDPEAVSGMEVPINGLMNDRFAAQTSNSVRRTFDNKRRNGEFIGAFAPYGYAKAPHDKNILVIDEEAAQVVRDVFRWFVYGDGGGESLSKLGIARKLNELGVPNPTLYKAKKGLRYKNPHAKQNDGLWTGTSISRMLQNKVYIGTMVQGRQRVISYKVHNAVRTPEDEWYQVENTHEAIVSRELFEKARELQKNDTRTSPSKKENYLFSGLLKCADCGKAMTRRASNSFVYYNCSTYKRKSKDKCTKHILTLLTATGCSQTSGNEFDYNKEITVVSREDGSGTRSAFIELVGIEVKGEDGTKKDTTTKEAIIAKQTDIMIGNISENLYSIGYISLGSLNSSVKAVNIDGVKPSSDNVKAGTYQIARPFNIATKGEISPLAQDFIDFILSAEGQSVVASSYIAVNDSAPAYAGDKPEGKITVAGSSSVTPIMEKLKEAYLEINPQAQIEVQQSDSSAGIKGVIDGTCDIGMASRELKDSEKTEVDGMQIAIDGIAVIVNPANPLESLTSEEVKAIYTGSTTSWNNFA